MFLFSNIRTENINEVIISYPRNPRLDFKPNPILIPRIIFIKLTRIDLPGTPAQNWVKDSVPADLNALCLVVSAHQIKLGE